MRGRALHIQGAIKGEMLFLYEFIVLMVYKLLSGPTIKLNPLIMTLQELTILLVLKMCKQVWKPTSSLIPSSQVMLLPGSLQTCRKHVQQHPHRSLSPTWPVSSIQHQWPRGTTVLSRSVLAWHRGASRSGPCISPATSPKPFLSPSSRSVPKA